MPIISIIIPVYNEEARIEQCIRSIQNQTIEDVEIIAVNDGSTDESYDILQRLRELDSRIIILNFTNKGAAVARTQGLKNSTGKYVGFVDADDWIEPTMFETLISTIETDKTDLVVCDILKEYPHLSYSVLQLSTHEIISERLLEKMILMEFDYSICNKLYKRDLLLKNNITFDEDLRLSQDALFNFCVFSCINKLSITPQPLYHYVAKENSLMASPQKKRIESFNYIITAFRNFCTKNNKEKEWKIFEKNIGWGYQKYLFNLLLKSNYTDNIGLIKYYRYILSHLRLFDPLLLNAPMNDHNAIQKLRSQLLKRKKFKTFALLATIRHKVIK